MSLGLYRGDKDTFKESTAPTGEEIDKRNRMKEQHYLVYMFGAVEPELYGPYKTQYALQQALMKLVARVGDLSDRGRGTVHQLTLINGKPHVYSFSGGYMEHIRVLCDANRTRVCDADHLKELQTSFPLVPKPK